MTATFTVSNRARSRGARRRPERPTDAVRAAAARDDERHHLGDPAGDFKRVVGTLLERDHRIADQASSIVARGDVGGTSREEAAVPA